MMNKRAGTTAPEMRQPDQAITVGIAVTAAEKREIYRFRYRIYVEEMAKHIKGIDHATRLLNDDMDEWGIIIYARAGAELIGTARINIGKAAEFSPDVAAFLSLESFADYFAGQDEERISFATKIMVQPAYRNSPVFYLLMAKCYELAGSNRAPFIFGICNCHLIRLYEKLGMHRYYKNFELPGYGLQAPIIFLVNDIAYLRTIRSPFYRLARRQGMLDSRSVKWFHEKFTAYSRFVNSETVTEAELWSLLSSHLSCPPNEAIALLNELTSIETKKFLHCCASLIPFEPGNRLTHQGDVSYAYNILVSGRIRSQTFLRPAKEYGRSGQHFGANGLTGHQCHREDLDAVESGEMLILSGLAFQRFYHTHPEIAHKITRRMLALQRSRYTEQA